jgi:hypothetical protein
MNLAILFTQCWGIMQMECKVNRDMFCNNEDLFHIVNITIENLRAFIGKELYIYYE